MQQLVPEIPLSSKNRTMNSSKFLIQLCILFSLLLMNLRAEAQTFMTKNANIVFTSTAPLLVFNGISNELNGLINFSESKVDFYLDLNTLDTGINLRNRHMRESYLETVKFPFVEFTGRIKSQINLNLYEPQTVDVVGIFNLHGVKKEITVQGIITPNSDSTVSIIAGWEILLADYNIERPRVVFYELSDIQTIKIDAKLDVQSP